MKTIDDILTELNFSTTEKTAFHEMISDAKRLQRNLMLEDLNKTLSAKINDVIRP